VGQIAVISLAGQGRQASQLATEAVKVLVMDAETLARINGEYAMPVDAGPAWRAAHAAGIDMSLLEASLQLTPEQRLRELQQVIDFLLEVQEVGRNHATE
jgi:hypothetical protein